MLAVCLCIRVYVWPLTLLSRGRRLHFLFLWLLPLWLPACLSLCLWPAIGGSVGSHIPAIVRTGSDVVCCPPTLLLFPTEPWCIFPSSIRHFGDKPTPFPGFMWHFTSWAITMLLIKRVQRHSTSNDPTHVCFSVWLVWYFCTKFSTFNDWFKVKKGSNPPYSTIEKVTDEQWLPRQTRVSDGLGHCYISPDPHWGRSNKFSSTEGCTKGMHKDLILPKQEKKNLLSTCWHCTDWKMKTSYKMSTRGLGPYSCQHLLDICWHQSKWSYTHHSWQWRSGFYAAVFAEMLKS